MRSAPDASVSGDYQRASCSDNACTAVFLCAVGTGNRSVSVPMASAGKKYRSAQGLWRWQMYLTR